MPAYLVSTVTISDPERFGAYMRAIAGLAERHGGRYLVRGPVTAQIEGDAPAGERVVVLEFPDESAARGYVDSAEYRAGKAHREGAGTVNLRLVAA